MTLDDGEVRIAVLCDHGERRPRLIDRIIFNPETGHAILAHAGNREQVAVDGRMQGKWRLLCSRCGLDVPLKQVNLERVARGLHEAGQSSVALPHLARTVASMGWLVAPVV